MATNKRYRAVPLCDTDIATQSTAHEDANAASHYAPKIQLQRAKHKRVHSYFRHAVLRQYSTSTTYSSVSSALHNYHYSET